MLSKFFYDIFTFWFKIAHYNFRWQFANSWFLPKRMSKIIKNKRLSFNINFLQKKFNNFINSYKDKRLEIWRNDKKVRVLWRQWIEKAPNIVKICIESIKRHSCWYDVVLLNKDNYKNYLELPDFILKKVRDKKITITHLSDIIRMWLLKQYWWIRVDATMFITWNVFKEFDNINLNTNYPNNMGENNWWYERWTWFFIWWKSNRLFNFVYDFLIKYHENYAYIINYFLIDYVIYISYLNFSDCKNDLDNITLKNWEIFSLVECFNDKYDKTYYNNLMKQWFFKLTYKRSFKQVDKNWNLTNYWMFLKWWISNI